jgi:hypothetical protein
VTDPKPVKPWYHRSLLPEWFSEWLAASVLIAIGFGVCFGLFLESRNPWIVAGVAGAIGFDIALVVLSLASARSLNTPEGQRLAPPALVRLPILTAMFGLGPFFWLTEGQIAIGAATDILGIAWLTLVVAAMAWRVRASLRRANACRPRTQFRPPSPSSRSVLASQSSLLGIAASGSLQRRCGPHAEREEHSRESTPHAPREGCRAGAVGNQRPVARGQPCFHLAEREGYVAFSLREKSAEVALRETSAHLIGSALRTSRGASGV